MFKQIGHHTFSNRSIEVEFELKHIRVTQEYVFKSECVVNEDSSAIELAAAMKQLDQDMIKLVLEWFNTPNKRPMRQRLEESFAREESKNRGFGTFAYGYRRQP